jgi:hypothetical protein
MVTCLSVDISVIFGAPGLMDLLFSNPICLCFVVGLFPANVFATHDGLYLWTDIRIANQAGNHHTISILTSSKPLKSRSPPA